VWVERERSCSRGACSTLEVWGGKFAGLLGSGGRSSRFNPWADLQGANGEVPRQITGSVAKRSFF